MQRILLINGPNLNMLGLREPEVYGTTTLADLEAKVTDWGEQMGLSVATFQSNHEGAIVDRIHEARSTADGIVLNGGAFTHYSYAIHDALMAAEVPTVEIHISNIHQRESWRRLSVTAPACIRAIHGRGLNGYRDALRILVNHATSPPSTVPYGDHPDQLIDLRMPPLSEPRGAAAFLHGGYWLDEWTRDTIESLVVDLTMRGWATANIEYRRTGEGGGWPDTLRDALTAIGAFHGSFETAPDSFAVIGHSAGGHLAAAAADAVKATDLVLLAPVLDLTALADHRLGGPNVAAFMGTDDVAALAQASPVNQPASMRHIIAHDPMDEVSPEAPTAASVAALEAAGTEFSRLDATGAGHFGLLDPDASVWRDVTTALS